MNYFSAPEDLATCAANVAKLQKLVFSKALSTWRLPVTFNTLLPAADKLRSLLGQPQIIPGVLWAFLNTE